MGPGQIPAFAEQLIFYPSLPYLMKYNYKLWLITCLAALLFLSPVRLMAGPFGPGNFVVVRVGDGSGALTTAATAVFLDEYTPAGVLVQTIDLPTSVSGNNRILTASGNATSEMNLTRSVDGRYLVLTGYSAAPGTPSVSATASVDVSRVIGRIAADGTYDTSTSTADAFSTSNIRAAVTTDGQAFYAVGGNSGVRYVPLGSVSNTQLNAAPTNIRFVNIAGGNLYISSASNPYIGLSQVGTGLPTTMSQSVTVLPGFPATAAGSSPYAFYFADLSSSVAGVDVVYVVDDRTNASGGIQKWSLVSGAWVLNGTITGSPAPALRGLNGMTSSGGVVSLVATGSSGLYFISDNAGYNAAPSVSALSAPIASAAANTAFRGVSFAPLTPAPIITSFTPTSDLAGATVTVTGTNFTGATAVTLNGVAVTGYTVVNATTITFTVPAGATSGPIAVTTPTGTATSTGSFTVVVPPVLGSLSPNAQVVGGPAVTITISGTGFTASSTVSFNGVTYTPSSSTATSLVVTIPASALTTVGNYPVTVTNAAGTSAPLTFSVTAPPVPTITSFTPTTGGPGVLVIITGTNFTGATAVSIGGFAVTSFTVLSATSIRFTVPSGTGSINGLIRVVTPGGTATSTTSFNLVSAAFASQALPTLMVFPNPATDHFMVILPSAGATTVALRDLSGRLVLAPAALAADQQLQLPATLAAGVYLLEVRQGSVLAVRRVVKE